MLKFDFGSETPTLTEVVTETDDKMRNIKPSMALVIGIFFRSDVPLPRVTVEISCVHCLSIAPYRESLRRHGNCGQQKCGRQNNFLFHTDFQLLITNTMCIKPRLVKTLQNYASEGHGAIPTFW